MAEDTAHFALRGLSEDIDDQRGIAIDGFDRLTLPRIARAHANVTNISSFDDVVKRMHDLFDGRIGVETVAYLFL